MKAAFKSDLESLFWPQKKEMSEIWPTLEIREDQTGRK